MSIKIVSDSSSNVFCLEGVPYTTVPMKVIAGDREYVDTPDLDVEAMVEQLRSFKGKSGSSCPNMGEWLEAFQGEDDIFALTISKNLSGSYNAACQAAAEFMEQNPGRKAFVFNTLTAGPGMMLLVEKLKELIQAGYDFETIRDMARDYHNHNYLFFCLESMHNLARNGRVNPAVAKLSGMLGIRVCGEARDGQVAPIHKPRGPKKTIQVLVQMLKERGFREGKLLRIAHCMALEQANALAEAARAEFGQIRVLIEPTTALCSYYAEAGGLMVGFEGDFNQHNHVL